MDTDQPHDNAGDPMPANPQPAAPQPTELPGANGDHMLPPDQEHHDQPPAAQPAAPANQFAEPMPTPPPAAPAKSGGQKKILLVEDDDALANVYQMRLENEGFDIRRVPNGEDALQAAIEYKPDLILLDVMMPKVSGFDVLDILRNTPETAKVKVVMLTALSQETDQQRAKELGVNDYLVKSQVVIADVVDRIKYNLGM